MADSRHRTTLGIRFRFLLRFAGLTGFLAVVVGAALFASAFPAASQWSIANVRSAADGQHGSFAKAAAMTLVVGAVAMAISLVAELLGGIVLVAGRRTAANATMTISTVAAVALLFFVNAYSYTHHSRTDFTRAQQFTLPPELAAKLRTLRPESPTSIVVLQKHRIFGSLSDDRDSFTRGAEEKVTEKVKDLVDLFREFGPRFNVEVLDTEAFGYRARLTELTKDSPELKTAIESAPENSIFFHANKRVQRLSFNEFLQLDKTASEGANNGRGNLVLLPQGVENFARRVLTVQERRPKVAVCVVHELLTTAYPEGRGRAFTMAGLKRSLTDHGYDVIDVVLKKNWASAGSLEDLKPAADTREESSLERLEGTLTTARVDASAARRTVELLERVDKAVAEVKEKPWPERNALYRQIIRGVVTEESEPELLATLKRQLARAQERVADAQKAQQEAEAKLEVALRDERTTEGRRIADAKEKLTRVLADVDLLVFPRFTIEDATEGPDVSAALHSITKEQAEVIRDFMAAGKPVLACLGPISGREGPNPDGSDEFERLVTERGVELGRDTVLFDGEAAAFASRRAGEQFGGGAPTDIPPLVLVEKPGEKPELKPNPVAAAARLTARSVDQKLDIRARAVRPVYLAVAAPVRPEFSTEFLLTSPNSWNEERPFPQIRPLPNGTFAVTDVPRFEPTPFDDPKKGTHEEERRGPFPIGVALEGQPPAHWTDKHLALPRVAALMVAGSGLGELAGWLTVNAEANQPKGRPSRLIVFGSGNLFSGPKLEPPQEKLLLHSVNWLTGRVDRLPRADLPQWEFPRVQMNDREFHLWRYGTAVGLPLLAVYLGLLAMMLRRRF